MGNPLSPVLADFFMNYIEQSIEKLDSFKYVKYWYRYVDDILCLWQGTERQLESFLNQINNINKNIQFTMELGGKIINYLDLTIEITNKKHEFNIYRKPTFSDNIIHYNSRHHQTHKLSVFHSMLHRLNTVPLSKLHFNQEIKTIKIIANNNGYDANMINNLQHKKLKKLTMSAVGNGLRSKEPGLTKWGRVTYAGSVSDKLNNVLKKSKFRLAFCNRNSLSNLLVNTKDRIDKFNQNGVYLLNCSNCSIKYIGQTGRAFKTRISDHIRCWKNKTYTSNFGQHLWEEDHNFDIQNDFKILHIEKKSKKLDNLEILEINRYKFNKDITLVNDQVVFASSPLLYPM